MQAIPQMETARRRAISGAALLVFGGGLALYQLTSLVLGPGEGSRQLQLTISVPAVDLGDLSEPVISNVNLVLGTLARPAAPAGSVAAAPNRVAAKPAPVSKAAPVASKPIVAPIVLPMAAPTPEATAHPLPPGVKPLPTGLAIVDSAAN